MKGFDQVISWLMHVLMFNISNNFKNLKLKKRRWLRKHPLKLNPERKVLLRHSSQPLRHLIAQQRPVNPVPLWLLHLAEHLPKLELLVHPAPLTLLWKVQTLWRQLPVMMAHVNHSQERQT